MNRARLNRNAQITWGRKNRRKILVGLVPSLQFLSPALRPNARTSRARFRLQPGAVSGFTTTAVDTSSGIGVGAWHSQARGFDWVPGA
ncbi:MAG: hypothetical protein JWO38_3566 [Gemmataceae bacterium]|nr:hypothetical protein [Gemmataceae bacterium]